MDQDLVNRLQGHIEQLVNKLRSIQWLHEWKFKVDTGVNEVEVEPDDSAWQIVRLGHQWDSSKAVWFRCKVTIPEKVCGVSTKDSSISGLVFIPMAGTIFVNSKEVADVDWLGGTVFPIENADKNSFTIAIKVKPGPGWARFLNARIFVEVLEDRIYTLELFLNILKLADKFIRWSPTLGKRLHEQVLTDAIKKILSCSSDDVESLVPQFEHVQELLKPVLKEAKRYTIHLIGHAHIDMNWQWLWQSTLNTAYGTFSTVDSLMSKFTKFMFSQSQAALYKAIENNHPALFKRIQARVKEKRWDITASTWVEGDLNMSYGETLVRHILYAKQYIKEKFNVDTKVCWCPDTFGHCWTYPQILKKSGIKFYYGNRCFPTKEYPLFWWEAPDGSRVLAFMGDGCAGHISPNMLNGLMQIKERIGVNNYLFVYGIGDHGGGPTRQDLVFAERLSRMTYFPKIKFDSVEGFFTSCLKNKKNYPVKRDELNTVFEGCYTTHADIKLMNRRSENFIPLVEALATISNILFKTEYPYQKFHTMWENTCFNQFHDILCGTGVHSTYDSSPGHAKNLYEEAINLAKEVLNESIVALLGRISYKSNIQPVVVFNPHSWERTDFVIINTEGSSIQDKINDLAVYDTEGEALPTQVEDKKIIFIATVPPYGYRTYYLGDSSNKFSPISVTEDTVSITAENEYFVLKLDKNSACILNLIYKPNKCDVIDSFKHLREGPMIPTLGNLFQLFYEKPHSMSAWTIGQISKIENIISPSRIEIKQRGPVRVVIAIQYKFNSSMLDQEIVLYRNIPRVDFFTTVDWQEKGTPETDAPMLKVSFPVSINSKVACFEIPFGYIYRQTNGAEVPTLNWLDLSDNGFGVSIINNCKYGCSVLGNMMTLTLLRSAYEPDTESDIGVHKFAYSIYPHRGDWKKANTVQRGYEFNQPLLCYLPDTTNTTNNVSLLPDAYSFICAEPSNVIISAIKKAQDGIGVIIRLYESQGRTAKGTITTNLPVRSIIETDLMERNIGKNKIRIIKQNSNRKIIFTIGKYEIKTLRLLV